MPKLKRGDLVELAGKDIPKKFKNKLGRVSADISVGEHENYEIECEGDTLILTRKDFNFIAPAEYDKKDGGK